MLNPGLYDLRQGCMEKRLLNCIGRLWGLALESHQRQLLLFFDLTKESPYESAHLSRARRKSLV